MKRIDWIIITAALLAATCGFVSGEAILSMAENTGLNLILTEGLHFAFLGTVSVLILIITIYKISPLKNELSATVVFKKAILLLGTGVLVLSFAAGALFQFLYNLSISGKSRFNNYIVAIDNSGSMSNTDPHYQRYEALSELMNIMTENQMLGIYVFSDDSQKVFDLQKIDKSRIPDYKAEIEQYAISEGGTEVMRVLNHIADDNIGIHANIAIILISDGMCEVEQNTLDRMKDSNIVVHTVQVSGSDAYTSLETISAQTYGDFYHINDISGLSGTFSGIHVKESDVILTDRRPSNMVSSLPHTLMRAGFIFLLSLIIKLFQILSADISRIRGVLIVQALTFSVLAGLAAEILFRIPEISGTAIRFVMTLLINLMAVTFIRKTSLNDTANNIFNNKEPIKSFDAGENKIIKSKK